MRRCTAVLAALLVGAALLICASAGLAATSQQTLTVHATVAARATLTLGVTDIHFPASDPDATPAIDATENPVSVDVKAHSGSSSTVTLTCQANGDLVSGGDTIGIDQVSWTVTGAGFAAGTMSKSSGVSAGSWTGSGSRSGTFSFALANSWSYATGAYSQTVVYTLTAP